MSAATTTIIAAMAAQRNRLIRHFVASGAVSEQTAIPAGSLPNAGFRLLGRLKDQGVIRTTADGRLFLDQARWERACAARRASARITAVVVTVVALAVAGVAYHVGAG